MDLTLKQALVYVLLAFLLPFHYTRRVDIT